MATLKPAAGRAPAKVAILGGGIAGLTAAHYLTRLSPGTSVVLLEAADRFGGWIRSISHVTPSTHPSQDIPGELIFEAGPRTLTTKGLSGWLALDVVKNLGLEHTILTCPRSSDAAKNRLLYYPDRIAPLPNSLPKLIWNRNKEPSRGLLQALWREPRQPRRPAHELGDESIDSFFRRRLGPEVADKIVSALCHGIYGGDSRQLSMHANFPQIVELERKYGGIIRGSVLGKLDKLRGKREQGTLAAQEQVQLDTLRQRFDHRFRRDIDNAVSWSMQGGIETLIEGLVNDLGERGVDIRLGAKVTGLSPAAEGVRIETSQGPVEATHVISTIPSLKLADVLPGEASLPYLRHNPSCTIGVINMAFFHAHGFHFLPFAGAGYLVPRTVSHDYNPYGVLGVTFDSDQVPNLDSGYSAPPTYSTAAAQVRNTYTKISILMGGPHWAGRPPHALPQGEELGKQALRSVQGQFDWPSNMYPSYQHVHLQRDCIPQYLVGHPDRMRRLAVAMREGPWRGKLSVAGASYTGVSVRECVQSGYEVARRLANGLPPTGLERIEAGSMGEGNPALEGGDAAVSGGDPVAGLTT